MAGKTTAAAAATYYTPSFKGYSSNSPQLSINSSVFPKGIRICRRIPSLVATKNDFSNVRVKAAINGRKQFDSPPLFDGEEHEHPIVMTSEVEESVKVLKRAMKTRKVEDKEEVLSALSVIEKAGIDSFGFLKRLSGSMSTFRTWTMTFIAGEQLNGGVFFPESIRICQTFDTAAERTEIALHLGKIGCIKINGRFLWSTEGKMDCVFETTARIKFAFEKTFHVNLGSAEKSKTCSSKNPLLVIWHFVDDEIAVATISKAGTLVWCRTREDGTNLC